MKNKLFARPLRTLAFALFAVCSSSLLGAAPTTLLPADSVYQLPVSLTDQQGRITQLADRRGHPLLVSMFYTSCQFVCPMLIDALRDTEAKLSAKLDPSIVLMRPDRSRNSWPHYVRRHQARSCRCAGSFPCADVLKLHPVTGNASP